MKRGFTAGFGVVGGIIAAITVAIIGIPLLWYLLATTNLTFLAIGGGIAYIVDQELKRRRGEKT